MFSPCPPALLAHWASTLNWFTHESMSKWRDDRSERSMSFKTVSETGWPIVGKVARGSEREAEAWAELTSMLGSAVPLEGDSLWDLDFTGLHVEGEKSPEEPPLPVPIEELPAGPAGWPGCRPPSCGCGPVPWEMKKPASLHGWRTGEMLGGSGWLQRR